MPIIKVDIYPSNEIVSLPQLCELLSIKMPVVDLSSQEAKNRSINNFINHLKKKVKEDTTIKINKSNERPLINKESLFELRMNFYDELNLKSFQYKTQIINILLEREKTSLEGKRVIEVIRQLEKKIGRVEGDVYFVKNFLYELIDKKIIRGTHKRFGIVIPDRNFDIISDDNYLAKKTFEKYGKALSTIRTFDKAVNYLIMSHGMFAELRIEEAEQKVGSLIAHYVTTGKMG